MKFERAEIGEKIGFTAVIDEKFKSGMLTVRFVTPLDGKTASENVLGIGTLSDTNSTYRTIAELEKALSELYGSSVSSFFRKTGDLQILGLTSSWLASRFAIYGEDIQGGMLKIFSDCLFSPNVENGRFDGESFAINQRELIEQIDSELNDKRGYAIAKAVSLAFEGEPAANRSYGSRETAAAVTSETAYRAYRRLLETAQIEAVFVSSVPDPNVEKMLREGFSAIRRRPVAVRFNAPSRPKSEPLTVSEEFDMRQCKMVMSFKTDSSDEFGLRMMCIILGKTPVSKLFLNVRERLGLCYYCSSQFSVRKGTLFVDCGMERGNIEAAKAEILRQIDEMKNGNISDDEIESALLMAEDSIFQVGDTMSSYSAWYFDCVCEEKFITPQDMADDFRKVTKERIVGAARSLKPDSVYLMLDKEVKQ